MQPTQTTNALTIVMELLGAAAGLLMLVLGVLAQLHPAAGYGASSATTMMVTGAVILAGAAHSNKWLAALMAKAPQVDSVLTEASQYLPILQKLLPASVGPLVAAGVTDLDDILKALASAQAAAPGTAPAIPAAQLAGGQGAAAPGKQL